MAKKFMQPWICEVCNVGGEVELDKHAGVVDGVHAIQDDHAAKSPDCKQITARIRVLSETRAVTPPTPAASDEGKE